jgi:hypothetical protein
MHTGCARTLALLVICLCWGHAAVAQCADRSVVDLQLTEFFKRPVGPRGLELSESLMQADGCPVRLTGDMVAREDATAGRFLIAPRPLRLSEHADGEADDLPPATVNVLLDPSQAGRIVVHRAKPVTLLGRLHLGRSEDAAGRVSWFRLQLDPQAFAPDGMAPVGSAAAPHP